MDNHKHFHLVRYFAYVTAPLIIVCIIIAAVTHRTASLEDLKKMGESTNVTLGKILSNNYVHQLESAGITPTKTSPGKDRPDWMTHDFLDRPISEYLKNTSVVRINVFTTDGLIAFSTNSIQLEKSKQPDKNAINTANKGIVFSEMKAHDKFVQDTGRIASLMIVETYMTISDRENNVIGVLELYKDITTDYQIIQSGLHLFIAVLFVLGLFFFYTVIYFVQKAERIIDAKQEKEKRDHEYLKIAFKKATESTKVKSEFLASMSHELRTPLNAIIGYSEILLEECEEENNVSAQKDLNNIKSAGVHLKTLIEEILDHAKIESGVVDIKTNNFRLRDIINSCVEHIEEDAAKNENMISIRIDDNIQTINTDETKIKRILLNLISNANKFTRKGTVTITAKIDDGNIVVRVKDTGVGIPAKQFHNIFEPFTQVDNSYTRQHGGTGLGLTISQEYAKALGGIITVSSREGEGTVMELHLPYCIAQHNENAATPMRNSPAA